MTNLLMTMVMVLVNLLYTNKEAFIEAYMTNVNEIHYALLWAFMIGSTVVMIVDFIIVPVIKEIIYQNKYMDSVEEDEA